MKKTPLIIVAAVAVVVVLAGIISVAGNKDSSSSTSTSDSMTSSDMNREMTGSDASAKAPANAVEATEVSIEDYKFGPQDIKVKVGTTVTWTNNDSVRHNVAGINNDLPEGKLIGRGETYTYTFKKAGVYNYLCTPHPYMKASVTVVE
jgi:amicyanin